MILSVLKAHWLQLCRDRVALFLVFVLPVVFFSVFAFIFGGTGKQSSKPADLKVVVWDFDQSETTGSLVVALKDVDGLQVTVEKQRPVTGEDVLPAAATPVQKNATDAVVVFRKGLEDSLGRFDSERSFVDVVYDSANPMAESMLSGVLQGAVFSALPDKLMTQGLQQFRQFGGPFSEQQQQAVEQMAELITRGPGNEDAQTSSDQSSDEEATAGNDSIGQNGFDFQSGLLPIRTVSARELAQQASAPTQEKPSRRGSMIAYYAASVAVMFLMFSMAGAASSLLADQENGTLDRLISGQMSIATLIVSHWVYYVLMGLLQLLVMFVFASLVFHVNLTEGPVLLGVIVMSLVTSMASAGFVMLLATLCRSRKQLESISTTIILVMSAFGGSMIPRPFLPEFVRETSKLTFNGWALDGYLKVLWYYDPSTPILQTLAIHLLVITLMALGFLWLAVWRAKRWSFS